MALPFCTEGKVTSIATDTAKEQIKESNKNKTEFARIQLVRTYGKTPTLDYLTFAIKVVEGEVKVGDYICISVYRNWKRDANIGDAEYHRFVNMCRVAITADMLDTDEYKKDKIIIVSIDVSNSNTGNKNRSHLKRSYRRDGASRCCNKVIRVSRPEYNENDKEINATFSNYLWCDVMLSTIYVDGEDHFFGFIIIE